MSRRRPHEEDDGYERAYRKRRRVSENQEIEDRLESLILRVGEKSTSSLESNLEGLASVLEADLSTFRAKVLRILTDCAIKMPEKCSIYTTLVGLLNAKNYNFGGEFVEHMVRTLKDSLKACNWDAARYALRFLADLVNCYVIAANSLLQLLDNLLDVAKEDGVPSVRKDWYVYAVMSCLPWVGRELYEKKEQALDMLMTSIEVYLNKRAKKHHAALRVWSSDTPHPQEEYLDCLWAQLRKLRNDNWTEKHLVRPYLAFDGVLCEALQHNIPTILPPPHHDSHHYPMPWVVFRMFDYTDCPEGPVLPGAHSIERWLIEEHLHQIIEMSHLERKDCAAHLLAFPYRANIPLDYCIVEVIFSELFNLPTPRYLEVFYGSLLIELCKLEPGTMPQVLAQATEILFLRIDTMNTSCFDRFVNWFSYHLSNFQFRWSWEDWNSCLRLDTELPPPKFIREVLLKSLRLSYFQRIKEIVPESFEALVPAKPEPHYKYQSEGAGEKETVEEILSWLEDCVGYSWVEIEEKWCETSKARLHYIYTNPGKVEEYFEKFPVLKGPDGYKLILKDFDRLFTNRGTGFLEVSVLSLLTKLLKLGKEKQNATRDVWLKNELNELLQSIEAALPGTTTAQQLMAVLRQKATSEEVLALLKELPNPREDDETLPDSRFNPLKIDVFVQTLLFLGSKSFSHSFAAISKYHYVFKILAESEEAQICILRSLYELWHDHQQMMCVLIDKMLKTQILECSAVANWIFSKEMTAEFTKLYLWEILHLTIRKMSAHVARLGRELGEARERVSARGGHSSSSEGDSSEDEGRGATRPDKPTEEMVERMEEKLEAAQADQKNLFLIIFQRFIMILSEHLVRSDTDDQDYNTPWYRWTIGRLQQVFLAHHEQVQRYSGTLETLLFTQDLDPHILDVFQQFVSLRA